MIRDSSSITWEPLNPIIKPISNYITIPKLIQTQIISIRDNLLYYGDYVDAFDEGTDYSEGLKFFSLSQYWSVFNSREIVEGNGLGFTQEKQKIEKRTIIQT